MTPKTDLFDLIHSLNKNEKGYFKRFCSRQEGEKKYILLFDFIEAQKEYNENDVLIKFRKEKFTRNFSVAKAYLYNTILESLHIYYSEISVEASLNKMLHFVEILFHKGLYKQCEEIVKKMLKIATAYEKNYHIIQCHTWTLKLLGSLGFKKVERPQLQSIFKSIEHQLEIFGNTLKHGNFGNELTFLIGREGEYTYKNIKKDIENIIQKSEEGKINSSESVRLQIFQKIIATYYIFYVEKDLDKSFRIMQESITLFDNKKELISEELITYTTLHANMLVIAGRTKNEKAFFLSLKKLREINDSQRNKLSPKQRASIFEHSYVSEFSYYIRKINFEKINTSIDAVIQGMEEYKDSLNEINRNILIVNTGIMLYGDNQRKQALQWFLKLINQDDIKTRPDVIAVAKMLIVIIHYEFKNFDILPSLIRSAQRFLKEQKLLSQIEIVVLKYIAASIKNDGTSGSQKLEQENLILKAKSELDVIEKSDYASYFNYSAWLTAQLEKKTYTEVLKRLNGN